MGFKILSGFEWDWHICPHTLTLFWYHKGTWVAYSHFQCYPECIVYDHYVSMTSSPQHTFPATSLHTSASICIILPIHSTAMDPPPFQPLLLHALQLNTPPVPWVKPLWHALHLHAHNDTLCSVVVSNAAVHPSSGYSSCARIIWSGTKLWSGEGYTPSVPSNLHSRFVEAYWLYVALSLLITYISTYPLILPQHPHMQVYCNNQGLVDWLASTQTFSTPATWFAMITLSKPNYTRLSSFFSPFVSPSFMSRAVEIPTRTNKESFSGVFINRNKGCNNIIPYVNSWQ